MKILFAPTENFIKKRHSILSADTEAEAGVIYVENNNGFVGEKFIVVGWEGSENAELRPLSGDPSGAQQLSLEKLDLPHKAGEPVTMYHFNRRKFYGSQTAGGAYTELPESSSDDGIEIEVNNPQGTPCNYDESGGEGYLYFKATYYDSISGEETSLSESTEVASDQSGRYTTINSIKRQAGLVKNPYITDDAVETYRLRAENEINSVLFSKYVLPLSTVPAIIENCCTLLAAGYMDYQEFGSEGEGVKWLGEARGILNSIKKGVQVLLDEDGNELAKKTRSTGVMSYPDQIDNTNGPKQIFTMDQKF